MIHRFFIKPARPDLLIRDPRDFVPLPAKGGWKPRNQHWLRRLRDGDVVEAAPADVPLEGEAKTTRGKA
jgi:hypothetical protein